MSCRCLVVENGSGPGESRILAFFPYEPKPKDPAAPPTLADLLRASVPGVRWSKQDRAYAIAAIPAVLRPLEQFATTHGFEVPAEFHALAERLRAEALANIQASRALEAEFDDSGLGGKLIGYQKVGAAFLVNQRRALLADQMGLGKTVQALAALWHLKAFPAVIVAPCCVKFNWAAEIARWLPGVTTEVVEGSILRGGAQITVINYDILHQHFEGLRANGCEAVILDEAHMVRDSRTRRFAAAKALVKGVNVRFLLTGTPMERPVDLLALLQLLGRVADVGGFWAFAKSYCAASQRVFKKSDGKKRWDFSGKGNVKELGLRLRATVMCRRLKSQVGGLPPKQRS